MSDFEESNRLCLFLPSWAPDAQKTLIAQAFQLWEHVGPKTCYYIRLDDGPIETLPFNDKVTVISEDTTVKRALALCEVTEVPQVLTTRSKSFFASSDFAIAKYSGDLTRNPEELLAEAIELYNQFDIVNCAKRYSSLNRI